MANTTAQFLGVCVNSPGFVGYVQDNDEKF